MIHALVTTLAYGETRRRMLTRRCPRCGHEQLTAEGKLHEPVPCDRCAVAIPPERASWQSGKGVTSALPQRGAESEERWGLVGERF